MTKPKSREPGMVHVYTGDGKGKTTCSMGLAFRAVGNGHKVLMIQFLKHSNRYGELKASKFLAPKFRIIQTGTPCTHPKRKEQGFVCLGCMACHVDPKKPKPRDFESVAKAFSLAKKEIASKKYNMVILDEINVAVGFGLLKVGDVLSLIKSKPENLELVLTGRRAKASVIKAADLVTEMKEIKHYFAKGVMARPGVEY